MLPHPQSKRSYRNAFARWEDPAAWYPQLARQLGFQFPGLGWRRRMHDKAEAVFYGFVVGACLFLPGAKAFRDRWLECEAERLHAKAYHKGTPPKRPAKMPPRGQLELEFPK